mgnify:CR=1 FL=1
MNVSEWKIKITLKCTLTCFINLTIRLKQNWSKNKNNSIKFKLSSKNQYRVETLQQNYLYFIYLELLIMKKILRGFNQFNKINSVKPSNL